MRCLVQFLARAIGVEAALGEAATLADSNASSTVAVQRLAVRLLLRSSSLSHADVLTRLTRWISQVPEVVARSVIDERSVSLFRAAPALERELGRIATHLGDDVLRAQLEILLAQARNGEMRRAHAAAALSLLRGMSAVAKETVLRSGGVGLAEVVSADDFAELVELADGHLELSWWILLTGLERSCDGLQGARLEELCDAATQEALRPLLVESLPRLAVAHVEMALRLGARLGEEELAPALRCAIDNAGQAQRKRILGELERRAREEPTSVHSVAAFILGRGDVPSWLQKRLAQATTRFQLEVAAMVGAELGRGLVPAGWEEVVSAANADRWASEVVLAGMRSNALDPQAWRAIRAGFFGKAPAAGDGIEDSFLRLRLLRSPAAPRPWLLDHAVASVKLLAAQIPALAPRLLSELVAALEPDEAHHASTACDALAPEAIDGAMHPLVDLAVRARDHELSTRVIATLAEWSVPRLTSLVVEAPEQGAFEMWLAADGASEVLTLVDGVFAVCDTLHP